jgi:6-phosphogluconolactonase
LRLIRAADAAAAAVLAAHEIAATCRRAVAERGRAVVAVSGGETPWRMLEQLRTLDLPWERIHVAQVDERLAPDGDPRRNLTRLETSLVAAGPLPRGNLLAMPVAAADPQRAAIEYQARLESIAGRPVVLDLVQLGLGTDGHTASLVPGDAALEVADRAVALTGEYQGLRRMTLTFPALNGARQRLWLVTGTAKAVRLAQVMNGDPASDVSALRVTRAATVVIADEDALTATPSGPAGTLSR